MSTVARAPSGKLVLEDISWQEYTRLLKVFDERPAIRLTYDHGTLELMTISFKHERYGEFIGRLVATLTEELGLPIMGGGSTTFRRYAKRRGLEPDNCYWIPSESKVRGKFKIDLREDPPPDLAIEIDISRSSMSRMSIYASIGVPEVWRFDGRTLSFHRLQPDETYEIVPESGVFPGLRPNDLVQFLQQPKREEENAVIRQFRSWIRSRVAAGWR